MAHDHRRRQDPIGSAPAAPPAARAPDIPAAVPEYEQRQRVCYTHARVLEGLLADDPANRPWLEAHGFSVDALVRCLRWNPAEQLRQLERVDPARRAAHAAQLRAEHRRNLRRMEENLAKVLPLLDECVAWSASLRQGRSRRTKKTLEIEELEVYAAGCTTGDTESTVYHSDEDRAPRESVDSDSVKDA